MNSAEIAAAVAKMQTKRQPLPEVWQNSNGTFSHHMDSQIQWTDRTGCETDLRFHREWTR